MKDMIYRDDAIKAIDCIGSVDTDADREYARGIIKALPSADAVSMEEHVKELNDLASAWKAKFVKAEKRTNEIYDETMARVAKECEECKERLQNLRPSAEAVQEWIPCSERLPKEEKKTYWVCTNTEYQCECRWTNNRFGIGDGEWGWSIFDTPQYSKPIAWMPLPKSYKGGDDE